MSTPTLTPTRAEPLTTVRVDDHAVTVRHSLSRCDDELPVVTVTAPVSLTLDDVTAALYTFHLEPAELADDDTVRSVVAEAVLNMGTAELDAHRCALARVAPGSQCGPHLARCRQRAAEVFAPGSPTAPGPPAPGGCDREPAPGWVHHPGALPR